MASNKLEADRTYTSTIPKDAKLSCKDTYNTMAKSTLYDTFKATLPNVHGKVFVITGTSSGIGFARHERPPHWALGGTVLLLNRPSSRASIALEQLQLAVPDGIFVPIECDLASFASVRSAIDTIQTN